jgi:outer membrane protein
MIKKKITKALFLCSLLTGTLASANTVGTVNLSVCLTDSKLGKAETANFEILRKQMSGHFESTEKEFNELSGKLNDSEYMDGLSPEAEMELREKVRGLNEEMMRYQSQFYQVMNQANQRALNLLSTQAAIASEAVAKTKKLDLIVTKDVCFYSNPSLDVTTLVITEMDKNYDIEAKKASEQAGKTE